MDVSFKKGRQTFTGPVHWLQWLHTILCNLHGKYDTCQTATKMPEICHENARNLPKKAFILEVTKIPQTVLHWPGVLTEHAFWTKLINEDDHKIFNIWSFQTILAGTLSFWGYSQASVTWPARQVPTRYQTHTHLRTHTHTHTHTCELNNLLVAWQVS